RRAGGAVHPRSREHALHPAEHRLLAPPLRSRRVSPGPRPRQPMTDLENEEARVLSAARRALTPSPGDAERIRSSLGVALAGGAITEAASAAPGPSTGPADGASSAAATSSAATSGVRLLGRLVLPALVAAGGF